MKEQITSLTR